MKINELRIGNLVKIPKKETELIIPLFIAKVQSIELFGILGFLNTPETKGVKWSIKAILPIELTEEWLKKFGFEEYGNTGHFKKEIGTYYTGDEQKNSKLAIKLTKAENWRVENFANKTIKLNYVHQLQNLFFVMTGRELI